MSATTLDTVQLDLAYLLGESSVPSPVPADRTAFIERALERVYRLYDFEMNKTTATVTFAANAANNFGVGTGPTDLRVDPDMDLRVLGAGAGDDNIFTLIDYKQQDEYSAADYRYWITGSQGAYTLTTTEPTVTAAVLRYTQTAPVINNSVSTPFPSSMCLARGALVYYRQAEDPQADISQLEALFQRELEEVISTQIRNQADKPAVTRHQVKGTFTGDVI